MELKLNATQRLPHESEREHLNRMRTWLNCYCVDASHATQFGKPAMISAEDAAALGAREWYRSSRMSLAIDVHLVAYVELLHTMRSFRRDVATPRSLVSLLIHRATMLRNHDECLCILCPQAESRTLTDEYNDKLKILYHEWTRRFNEHPQANGKRESTSSASVRSTIPLIGEYLHGKDYMCPYRADGHRM